MLLLYVAEIGAAFYHNIGRSGVGLAGSKSCTLSADIQIIWVGWKYAKAQYWVGPVLLIQCNNETISKEL